MKDWGFTDFDFQLAGWDMEEEPLPDPGPQIDKAAELQEKWGTALGQVWELGEHRLVCGDCTDAAVVEAVMGGEKAEVLFTSPPYADQREYGGSGSLAPVDLAGFISVFRPLVDYQVVNLGIKRNDGEIISYWDHYIQEARHAGYKFLSWNVWDKGRATSVATQTAMFAIEHEWIFVFGIRDKDINRTIEKSSGSEKRLKYARKDKRGRLVRAVRQQDGSFRDSVIGEIYEHKNLPSIVQCFPQMARDITTAHPAPFPVDLVEWYLDAMTDDGKIAVDPFCGSGTTIIACERLNRRCRAIEIEPKYVAVTLERWATMTGREPVLVEGQ